MYSIVKSICQIIDVNNYFKIIVRNILQLKSNRTTRKLIVYPEL